MAGTVITLLTHISPEDPLIFMVLNLESTFYVFESGAKSCLTCWGLTDARLRQETSQCGALSRGHLILLLGSGTQPCPSPALAPGFPPLSGLWLLLLSRKARGSRYGGLGGTLRPDSRQPRTTTTEEGAGCAQARLRREGLRESEGDRNLPSPAGLLPCLLTLAQLPVQCTVGMRGSGTELRVKEPGVS